MILTKKQIYTNRKQITNQKQIKKRYMRTFTILMLVSELLGIILVVIGARTYRKKEEMTHLYKRLMRTSNNDDEINKFHNKLIVKNKMANSLYIIGSALIFTFTLWLFSLGTTYQIIAIFNFMCISWIIINAFSTKNLKA